MFRADREEPPPSKAIWKRLTAISSRIAVGIVWRFSLNSEALRRTSAWHALSAKTLRERQVRSVPRQFVEFHSYATPMDWPHPWKIDRPTPPWLAISLKSSNRTLGLPSSFVCQMSLFHAFLGILLPLSLCVCFVHAVPRSSVQCPSSSPTYLVSAPLSLPRSSSCALLSTYHLSSFSVSPSHCSR